MKKILSCSFALLLIIAAKAQWIQQNAGFTNDTLGFYEMSLPNKNTAWAVCFDIRRGVNAGKFVLDFTRTTDGGATWKPGKMGNDFTLQFANISAIDEMEAWVAMNKRFNTGGGLYHTVDGGVTWTKESADEIFDDNSYPNFVHFRTDGNGQARNKGMAMGDPNNGYWEVYTTMNGGKKWKRVPESSLPAMTPGEFGWISGFAAVEETVWFGTSAGRMYKTTDFGKSWTVHTVDPSGSFVMEIAFDDDKLHGVTHVRNNSGTFLYSTADGGLTWTNLGQPAGWKSSRITAVPGTDALVSTGINGNRAFNGSAISYDNGATWTELENIVPKTVSRFYDAETGYACGAFVSGPPLRGGIFKSAIVFQDPAQDEKMTMPGLKKMEQARIEAEQLKIYPTPANDVVHVVLQDAFVNARSVISIIGMNGRVLESKTSTGVKSIQLNVSKLPAGMYTIRIATNAQVTNRVITILR
jgi:photosystem II stability/assembly factor-like uncharacterized protein